MFSTSIVIVQSPTKRAVISTDTSFGLGAVLLQYQEDMRLLPVAYASRAMSETRTHTPLVEKKALAITWACEQFSEYLIGLEFTIEMNHKPLVSPLSFNNIN